MPQVIHRIALLLLLCLMGGNGFGQVYFEIMDDHMGWTERSSNPILLDDSIYWTTAGYNFLGDNGTHLSFLKISQEGTIINKTIDTTGTGRYAAGSICAMGDTGVLCLTSYNNLTSPSNNFQHRLTAFDRNGGHLWERTYLDSGFSNTPNQIIPCDSGYLIVGQRYHETDGDAVAMKVDSVGNLTWKQSYGGSLYESGRSGVQTSDGGFLLLGWTRSFGSGQKDFYLIKVDDLGNQQWQRTYGGAGNEGGVKIKPLSDGNFLLIGGGSDDGFTSFGRLVKVDDSGGVVWQTNHSMQNGNGFFDAVELEDSSLVLTGLTTTSGESNAGWLVKTNSFGELIWQRKYNKSASPDLFYSILTTDDGGFLLSGQAINDTTGSQDAWLLKVDSIGCPYPNCLVGIDELGSQDVLVDAWPNPANDVLNLEVGGSAFNGASPSVTVVDMQGRVVCVNRNCHGLSDLAMTGTGTIDVSGWPNGLYVITLTTDRQQASVRVVVQH